jgi:dTDP-4-amino-4,6-dideoxygalactose transaminase
VCGRRGIPLVEDAAQSHGARYKDRPVGTFGELSAFSFYPGKNLGACGEAGALLTDNAEFAKRACALREHGSTARYYHDEVGYNYRMEGIQGAVLDVKLRHLPAWTAARRRIAHRYHGLLASTPLKLPVEAPGIESVYHLYVVRHPKRDRLREHLEARGIGTALHYPLPLHLQKCFADLGHKAGDFPVAEAAAKGCISLPIYPDMSDAQVEYVAAMIREFKDW